MNLKKKILTGGFGALALLATSAAAFAAPATATANVNVRSGPGTGYAVVDTLRRGEHVEVDRCRGSWCFVTKSGPDGWVSANYLGRYTSPPPRPSRPNWDRWDDRDRWDRWDRWERPRWRPAPRPNNQVCFGAPNASFCFSN